MQAFVAEQLRQGSDESGEPRRSAINCGGQGHRRLFGGGRLEGQSEGSKTTWRTRTGVRAVSAILYNGKPRLSWAKKGIEVFESASGEV